MNSAACPDPALYIVSIYLVLYEYSVSLPSFHGLMLDLKSCACNTDGQQESIASAAAIQVAVFRIDLVPFIWYIFLVSVSGPVSGASYK